MDATPCHSCCGDSVLLRLHPLGLAISGQCAVAVHPCGSRHVGRAAWTVVGCDPRPGQLDPISDPISDLY
eukprot:2055778-Alexandrium_andersonii.AAC.1